MSDNDKKELRRQVKILSKTLRKLWDRGRDTDALIHEALSESECCHNWVGAVADDGDPYQRCTICGDST